MRTIFYIPSEDDNGDYWFHGKPYKRWFVLKNVLYDADANVHRHILDGKYQKSIVITDTQDRFLDKGITRRIAVTIL